MSMDKNDIKIKQTQWDLTPLFEGDEDPKIADKRKMVGEEGYKFINKWKDRSDYLESPAILEEALDEYEKWQRFWGSDGDEGYYFWLRTSQDENDPGIKAKFNKIIEFGKKIQNDVLFFELRLAKVPEQKQKEFLGYDGLEKYRHFLEMLFKNAKYQLSEAEEKILNLKHQPAQYNWTKMVSGFLSKEEREVVLEDGSKDVKNFSEISSLMNSQNKTCRDSAGDAFNDILRKNVEVAEAEMNSILLDKKINDGLRGIPRPDFTRHLSDDIDSEIVDVLLESVSEKFDISQRYYKLKARLMGVPKLRYHERNVPYGDAEKEYSFEDSADLVYKVFKDLDSEFADILKMFLDGGHIDVYPSKGKSDGAFCAHNLISQPVYILLNHTGKLRDVLTFAHELGHGINNELTRQKQDALNFGSPLSTAEVASTFMEDFVLEEILKEADNELRLAIMMSRLNDDISTIFRQVACYNFEKDLHQEFRQKGYLSKEEIGKIFQKHMASYMGEAIEMSSGSENWWVYWSHIRNFFYVYSYASGLLISKSLQESTKADNGFVDKVKGFLSAGMSDSPKNIFNDLGIDISQKEFWEKGIEQIGDLLQRTEDLAKKLGKL